MGIGHDCNPLKTEKKLNRSFVFLVLITLLLLFQCIPVVRGIRDDDDNIFAKDVIHALEEARVLFARGDFAAAEQLMANTGVVCGHLKTDTSVHNCADRDQCRSGLLQQAELWARLGRWKLARQSAVLLLESVSLTDEDHSATTSTNNTDFATFSTDESQARQVCGILLVLAFADLSSPAGLPSVCLQLVTPMSSWLSEELSRYSLHTSLWLAASELDYLLREHGSERVVAYLQRDVLPPRGEGEAGEEEEEDDGRRGLAVEESSAMRAYTSAVLTGDTSSLMPHTPLSAAYCSYQMRGKDNNNNQEEEDIQYNMRFVKDLMEAHAKLTVFWDELGAPACSARHHAHFTRALFAAHPRERPAGLLALLSRALLTSPPVVASKQHATALRSLQAELLMTVWTYLSNATTAAAIGYNIDIANTIQRSIGLNTSFCALASSYEQYFTSTPPSMMIGYERSELGTLILGTANDIMATITEQPAIEFTSNHHQYSAKSVVKVGFLSCFFYDHSVGRLVNQQIVELSREARLQVTVILLTTCTGYSRDAHVERLKAELLQSSGRFVELPSRDTGSHRSAQFLPRAVSFLRALELDVLVYPELGMDAATLAFARHRVAPLQLVFWGHPTSQGLANIDYAVSSELFEDQRQHSIMRSEQVILLRGMTTIFEPPPLPNNTAKDDSMMADLWALLSLAHAGGEEGKKEGGEGKPWHLFLLPHTAMKYSTEFDSVLLGILKADPYALLLLLYSPSQYLWFIKLWRRLYSTCLQQYSSPAITSGIMSRLVLRPKLPKPQYLALLSQSVAVLDSFPFGMGVTALEALSLSVPVVTLPSRQTTLRLVGGMLWVMGLTHELRADNATHFIAIAALLGTDSAHRSRVVSKISEMSHLLFSTSEGVVEEWTTMLLHLVRARNT